MDESDSDLSNAIAIVGMAGRFPGAGSIAELWTNLCNGTESIRPFTPDELAASGVTEKMLKNPDYVNSGAPLEAADCFDAGFFGYLPREAELMDPQHRIFLECAWSALEDAGYDPAQYDGDIGVFGGVARNTYFLRNAATYSKLMASGATYDATLGSDKDYAATRVAYQLNLNGPAMSIQTACSSSGVAVHVACQALLNGECDMALAGGARVQVPLTAGYQWVEGGIPSPDGHCRPFDKDANGTVYGSGVAIVVLKRLEDALDDRDHIYSVILGSAINNDGAEKVGFTAPSIRGQTAVIESALGMADVSADSIGYVEAHGTGTSLGDPIEVAALTSAYRKQTDRKGYCSIGSLKSNIGHLDAGAGVAGLIKTSLMLHHKKLVPSLNFRDPNPQLDLENSPFYVSTSTQDWQADSEPRRAALSAFGLGGTNFHIVLEEAPEARVLHADSTNWRLLFQSAKSPEALDAISDNLANALEGATDVDLDNVSYTLAVGRSALSNRRVTVASAVDEAVSCLRSRQASNTVSGVVESPPGSVVFLFSGQGAQYAGMGRDLYEEEPVFREVVDQCCAALEGQLDADIKEIVFGDPHHQDKKDELLNETRYTQPALFVLEYALAKLWMSKGIMPDAVAGHSIGELVAACIAGVFDLDDALKIIVGRGKLMQSMKPGDMLAINLAEEDVRGKLPKNIEMASINTPTLCVVSGTSRDIAKLQKELEADSIQSTVLKTSHAFHSKMMEPALKPFQKIVANIDLRPPQIPIASNVTGDWMTEEQAIDPGYWSSQIRSAVRMSDCVGKLLEEQSRALIELGPGNTLCSFVRRHPAYTKDHTVVQSVRHPTSENNDLAFFHLALGQLWCAGYPLDWKRLYPRDDYKRVSLPTYPFERKQFWLKAQAVSEIVEDTSDAILNENLAGPTLAEPAVSDVADCSRQDLISIELCSVLEELSGIPKEDLDIDASFVEMGFDSLFLTRANSEFKKACGVDIGFRQLLDEAPSISALANYVDNLLPEDSEKFKPTSVVPVQDEDGGKLAAMPTSDADDVNMSMRSLIEKISNGGEGFERVISHQLQVIQGQLELLGSIRDFESTSVSTSLIDEGATKTGGDRDHRLVELEDKARWSGIRANIADFVGDLKRWEDDFIAEVNIATLDSFPGVHQKLNALCSAHVLEFFRSSNLDFVTGSEYSIDRLKAELKVLPDFDRFVNMMLTFLKEDGAIEMNGGQFRVLPAIEAINLSGEIASDIRSEYPQFSGLVDMLNHCAENYRAAISGDIHSVSVLMPDGRRDLVKQKLTQETVEYRQLRIHELVVSEFISVLAKDRPLRILEVGAGGGDLTWQIVSRIGDLDCVYHYTDVAPVFVADAEKRVTDEQLDWVICDILDISKDPSSQGFRPEAYDVVVGLNVVHATPDISIALNNMKDLLVPGGILCLVELVLPTRWEHMIWGLAKGWWLFNDSYRQDQPLLSMSDWQVALEALDLDDILALPDGPAKHSYQDSGLLLGQKQRSEIVPSSNLGEASQDPYKSIKLTESQSEIWLAATLSNDANRCFNLTNILRLSGPLDIEYLRSAVQKLVNRHEALRTQIREDGSGQTIIKSVSVSIPTHDFSNLAVSERDGKLKQLFEESALTPFDLSSAPLFRPQVVTLSKDEHVVILTVHHIICDGWSTGVLMRELGVLYKNEKQGVSTIPPPEHQLSDFVDLTSSSMFLEKLDKSQEFWLSKFSGQLPILSLPTDRGRGHSRTFNAGRVEMELDADVIADIHELGRKNNSTFFNTLLSSYVVYLHRISQQNSLIIGISAAQQPAIGMPELISHSVSMLPLRFDLDPNLTFSDLLKITRNVVLDAFDYQDCSYGRLIPHLNIDRSSGRPPLISAVFNLDPSMLDIEFDDLQVLISSAPRSFEIFELFFTVVETTEGGRIECTYNADLFDQDTIVNRLYGFGKLLSSVCQDVQSKIQRLDICSDDDLAIIRHSNSTFVDYGSNNTVFDLITHHLSDPDRPAIEFDGIETSYGSLQQQANQLANFLRSTGVEPGSLVGIHMERSSDMLVAILGVMKAGCAYLPLDPGFPVQRLEYMLADSGTEVLITQESLVEALPGFTGQTIAVDRDSAAIGACSTSTPEFASDPQALAYVLYTSGSTGRPKGVMVPHSCVVNFLSSMAREPGLGVEDTLVAVTTTSFDISVLELFLPLTVGAKVVIASSENAADGAGLKSLLEGSNATVMQATPTTWRILLDAGWEGSQTFKVLCGGEPLPQDLARELIPVCGELWNLYGPTETTIWSSCAQITDADAPITIGRPIANTQIYVLDDNQQLQPIGVSGELCIAGAGVSLGYMNQPALTSDVFIPSPFSDDPDARLYRTGDLVRWRNDGTLQHLGRIDGQVKIRGFRIELGEIESVLAEHDSVKAVACNVWQAAADDHRLVAYIVPSDDQSLVPTELRNHLRGKVPDYMVPQYFEQIESIPLTANGKRDRANLPDFAVAVEEFGKPPTTDTEKYIANLWEQLLGVPNIFKTSDFFALGGHSILAIKLITTIRKELSGSVPLVTIFDHSKLSDFCSELEQLGFSLDKTEKREVLRL